MAVLEFELVVSRVVKIYIEAPDADMAYVVADGISGELASSFLTPDSEPWVDDVHMLSLKPVNVSPQITRFKYPGLYEVEKDNG